MGEVGRLKFLCSLSQMLRQMRWWGQIGSSPGTQQATAKRCAKAEPHWSAIAAEAVYIRRMIVAMFEMQRKLRGPGLGISNGKPLRIAQCA